MASSDFELYYFLILLFFSVFFSILHHTYCNKPYPPFWTWSSPWRTNTQQQHDEQGEEVGRRTLHWYRTTWSTSPFYFSSLRSSIFKLSFLSSRAKAHSSNEGGGQLCTLHDRVLVRMCVCVSHHPHQIIILIIIYHHTTTTIIIIYIIINFFLLLYYIIFLMTAHLTSFIHYYYSQHKKNHTNNNNNK